MAKTRPKRVLQDHKKVGSKYVPVLMQEPTRMKPLSYVKRILPELLWIELFADAYGPAKGYDIARDLVSKATQVRFEGPFPFCSAFGTMTPEEQTTLVSRFSESELKNISSAITPLVSLYPECPMAFLLEVAPSFADGNSDTLGRIRSLVDSLLDSRGYRGTLMQGATIYLLACSDKLRIARSAPIPDLNALENYPDTEDSRKTGAHVRASVLAFSAMLGTDETWPRYFWNQGLKLESCVLPVEDQ